MGIVDRSDISSWLDGPKKHLENSGIDFGYPGQRLGMPETGVGRVASMGRRLVALMIDWVSSIAIVHVIAPHEVYGSPRYGLLTLQVFAAEVIFFTVLLGGSFGQRCLRIRITQLNGSRPKVMSVLIRTVLLCLVIPAAIWDRDSRGLHDKASSTVAVRD